MRKTFIDDLWIPHAHARSMHIHMQPHTHMHTNRQLKKTHSNVGKQQMVGDSGTVGRPREPRCSGLGGQGGQRFYGPQLWPRSVAVVEATGLVEVKPKTRIGSLSASWATWSRT